LAQHWNSEVLDDNHQKRRAGVLVARQPVVDPARVFAGPRLQRDARVQGARRKYFLRRAARVPAQPFGYVHVGRACDERAHDRSRLGVGIGVPQPFPQTQTGPSSPGSSVEGKKCETKEKQTLVARDLFALTSGKRPRV